ncbi:DUF2786 domain-containing protein [Gallaecimonas kandeliae]|uniref:DUF2786 domain-containing protein n=1 Tax=Gallaecimonas kandeliae TaxID=3029055 RepID=UPI002647FF89|nr:DUF2786 domain-containing protein [Gallaecimonas kandeliae]WKE65038.1 DUF2786 domain-containing protein [Gallaecimonas kandeliae]
MDDRILAKIKKLMALANRTTNPHEAASALAKAQALMAAHQLTESDVALSAIDEASAKLANKSQTQPRWSHMLVSVLTRAFGVEAIFRHQWFDEPQCHFIGPSERVEVAVYCYTVLARQLTRARREYLATLNKRLKTTTKTARADLYCEGWVFGVREKVEALVPTEQEADLISQYFAKHYPNTQEGKARQSKTTKRDHSAADDGYQDGRQVQLSHGVKGAAQPAMLGKE